MLYILFIFFFFTKFRDKFSRASRVRNDTTCVLTIVSGYGFVDFESGTCADAAVKGLQAKGVQAQMAKVGIPVQRRAATVRLLHGYIIHIILNYIIHRYVVEHVHRRKLGWGGGARSPPEKILKSDLFDVNSTYFLLEKSL